MKLLELAVLCAAFALAFYVILNPKAVLRIGWQKTLIVKIEEEK